jgi:hypothetical protein
MNNGKKTLETCNVSIASIPDGSDWRRPAVALKWGTLIFANQTLIAGANPGVLTPRRGPGQES